MLCAAIAISALGVDTAQAATTKMPLKLTVDGKSYTFTKDAKKTIKSISIKKIKKAFGKPAESSKGFWRWNWSYDAETGTATSYVVIFSVS